MNRTLEMKPRPHFKYLVASGLVGFVLGAFVVASLASAALWVASCRLAASLGMSRPLKSIIISPSWPSTMPAPTLMRIAIPAIAAKAAKRLPLMPHRSCRKRNRRNLPDVDGNAIKVPAPVDLEVNRVAVSRYLVNKIGKMPGILRISPWPNKRPA